jgi:16S rRNA (guanine527-N7)-methyltransferase
MVAASDAGQLRERHILDSLRGAPLVPAGAGAACDLGSGAGLPGIPIAVARPALEVTLVEARRARAAFLELVVDHLRLTNVRVVLGRVEDVDGPFGACFARGFADATTSWAAARRLIAGDGVLLYWAGTSFGPSDAPPDVAVRLVPHVALESGGPIVIMTRQ